MSRYSGKYPPFTPSTYDFISTSTGSFLISPLPFSPVLTPSLTYLDFGVPDKFLHIRTISFEFSSQEVIGIRTSSFPSLINGFVMSFFNPTLPEGNFGTIPVGLRWNIPFSFLSCSSYL